MQRVQHHPKIVDCLPKLSTMPGKPHWCVPIRSRIGDRLTRKLLRQKQFNAVFWPSGSQHAECHSVECQVLSAGAALSAGAVRMNRQAVKASRQAVKAQSCARGTQCMREAVNRRQSTLFNAAQRCSTRGINMAVLHDR
jgi:hypothetical protein